jgi:adenylate cyclase
VLNEIFSVFDSLAQKWGVEKIKTIGDAYMVVCGLEHRSNCAEPVADFALEMVDIVKEYAAKHNFPISIRVGISTGQVTSGVIGLTKPTFDVWGETVTLASRMEALAATERVQVSETTFWRLREDFELEPRGPIEVKGFGRVEAYFLIGRRTVASQTAADVEPARPDGARWFVAARPAQTEAAAPVSNAPARVDGTHERASQPHGRDERT